MTLGRTRIFRSTRTLLAGLTVSIAMTHAAHAQTGSSSDLLDHYVLYGINSSDKLIRYTFADAKFESLGTVQDTSGSTLSGIQAAAHVPGNLNLFGFWTDPSDSETKLVYIDSETAETHVIGQSLGRGLITGATISWKDGDNEIDDGGDNISGLIDINPNNSPSGEFKLIKPDGQPGPKMVTRDNLHQNSPVSGGGVYYQGKANYIRVRPQGPGIQSTLSVNGVSYPVTNDHTYVISGGEMDVTVYNDHINSKGKAMGQWMLDISNSGSAVVHEGSDTFGYTGLFALQEIEANEESPVAFDIVAGQVVPQEDFAAKITVIGAAITNGSYEVPVTLAAAINGTGFTPFGAFNLAVSSNVNDDNNPRKYVLPKIYPAGTPLDIRARAWVHSHGSGKNDSHWSVYLTTSTSINPGNMHVLKHGDTVPNHPAFTDPNQTLDFVMDFVDHNTNTIVLDENQAIVLFELGTTDPSSAAADFDDLVVLVTLARDPADLMLEDDDDDDAAGPASRLVKVHSITGGFEQIMTLNRVYDSLAASHNGMFYAAHDGQLFELNPYEQTETLMGSMPNTDMTGLEFAGPTICGFTMVGDELYPMDVTTGAAMGSGMGLSTQDLGTIIFMEEDAIPASLASFD